MTENPTFSNEKPSLQKDEGFSFADFVTKRRTKPTVRCTVYLDYAGAQEYNDIEDDMRTVAHDLETLRKRDNTAQMLALGETDENANEINRLEERMAVLTEDLARVHTQIAESALSFALSWSDWERPGQVSQAAMTEWLLTEAPAEIKAVMEKNGEDAAVKEAMATPEHGHKLTQFIGAACLRESLTSLTDFAGEPVAPPATTKEAVIFLEKALAPDQRERLLTAINKSVGSGGLNGKAWFASLDAGFSR